MVLDANVLVRLVVSGEYEEQGEALWRRIVAEQLPCVAPAFCPTEVISSIRQMGRGDLISAEEEEIAIRDFVTRLDRC